MITYDALVRFAKTLEGETLETSARSLPFTVEVDEAKFVYTRDGKQRRDYESSIEKVLARFNEKKSYKVSDYQDITRNASYLLRLIELMTSGKNT